MNKRSIFDHIIVCLENAREKAEQGRDAAQKEANLHVGRMESRYDTFKQEAQYAVAAQESRMSEYEDGIGRIRALLADDSSLDPQAIARVGSVVMLASETGETKWYVLSPVGGGITISDDALSLFTLTPESPLGKQLLGLKVGDVCGRYTVKEIF